MKVKEALLPEYKDDLNNQEPLVKVRKGRSDKGQSRPNYTPSAQPRADKGKLRGPAPRTAALLNRIFNTFLLKHTNLSGGDDLMRDDNGIFPPEITHYYKRIKNKDGIFYKVAVKRANPPEYLRWQWYMQMAKEKPETIPMVANHYFLKEEELFEWTYNEWAWAYYHEIRGMENRMIKHPIILQYNYFLQEFYNGFPNYNDKGDIDWSSTRKNQ